MHLVRHALPRSDRGQDGRWITRRLIGIGNPDRGDDAAGWEVAGLVTSWSVERRMAGSFDLVHTWSDDDEVVIVDAMRTGEKPGTIREFDARTRPLPVCAFSSTHAFGPSEIVELARSLDRIPRSLKVIGIEIEAADIGMGMSPKVKKAVKKVAQELEDA